jgi:hypothetical protein
VKLLAAEPVFGRFLNASKFSMVIGLDAITDTRAIDELKKLGKRHANLELKLFLHKTAGSIFHPKTMWLKTARSGVIITGSGNLTSGGLVSNWEAIAVEQLTLAEITLAEHSWDTWLKTHRKQLLDLDDPKVVERAKANRIVRSKVKGLLKERKNEDDNVDAEAELIEDVTEEIEKDILLHSVLVAEVPSNGPRWKQVGFSLDVYKSFFGVTRGTKKHVRFYQVRPDGTLSKGEDRESVEVASENYRFELGAASGLAYPAKGHPIVVFEKISDTEFKYVLLMPPSPDHKLVQKYLNDNHPGGRVKRRIPMTMGDLAKIWPKAPFFL